MTVPTLVALFDMDGVLIDSVKQHWQAVNEVLADYGCNVPDNELRKYIGQPLYSQVEQLNEAFGIQLDYDEVLKRTTVRKQVLNAHLQAKEGVVTLLDRLKAQNTPMAVATSNTKEETERRLEIAGIRDYFSALITEDDVTEHKPNPMVYLTAAKAVHANPKDCVVFEDAPAGITAAKRAGMKCIAVQVPYTNAEDIAEADISVASLGDVTIELITNLF